MIDPQDSVSFATSFRASKWILRCKKLQKWKRKTGKHSRSALALNYHLHVVFFLPLRRHMQMPVASRRDTAAMVFVRLRGIPAEDLMDLMEGKKQFGAFVFIAAIHHELIWTCRGIINHCVERRKSLECQFIACGNWYGNREPFSVSTKHCTRGHLNLGGLFLQLFSYAVPLDSDLTT